MHVIYTLLLHARYLDLSVGDAEFAICATRKRRTFLWDIDLFKSPTTYLDFSKRCSLFDPDQCYAK